MDAVDAVGAVGTADADGAEGAVDAVGAVGAEGTAGEDSIMSQRILGHGSSRWHDPDGTWRWAPVTILRYDDDAGLFDVQWVSSGGHKQARPSPPLGTS